MLKTKLLLLLLMAGSAGYSQAPLAKDSIPVRRDTIPQKDTLIQELQEGVLDNIPVVSMDENDFSDGSAQNVSSVLTAGRDPFFSAAAFNWSPVRFRIRGYDADLFTTFINGMPMENLDNGFTPFGLWGGLNDVLRNRDISMGLQATTFAFGDIGSNTNIDVRASKQRKQTSFSYALSNRNYRHRMMLTHSTGLSKKGWAFTFSGSARYADEGYVPGTFYRGFSFFAAVDKQLGQKHLLSFSTFGAPTESGRQGASVKEMQQLAGTNYYNPLWGFQEGKKRNASVARTNQPFFMLNHEFRISNNTRLNTGASFSFGERSVSALDWYNSADPRPDYYRYLPSYYAKESPAQFEAMTLAMQNDINLRQINWDRLYLGNRNSFETIKNVNGVAGNDISGRRSRYVLEERVIASNRFNFNTVLNTRVKEHIDLTFGASYQQQNNHYFKRLEDLLGGDFYVDLNQFAEREFPNNPNVNQNNIDQPNRVVREGDRFGYNYEMHINRAATWAQGVFKYNKIDLFLAGELSYTRFWREGLVRNGLFPDNSFGKSNVNKFLNYALKGGITYKIDGRNYLYANGSVMTRPPFFENVYIAPRTRDFQQQDIQNVEVTSFEAGYILNAPKLKLRFNGYYTASNNDYNVMTFFHDDFRNFVNYALSNIDRIHFGGEFGFEAKLTSSLSLNGAAALGRYYFNSRQEAIITLDNRATLVGTETIYSKNYRVPSTPQEAYSLGLNYRSPKFWYVSLTGSYFDQMWLDFNPIRRTATAIDGLEPKTELWNSILGQTQWEPQFTLDFFGGYSWKLPRRWEINGKNTFLVFNMGVNNILNNKEIITGGFEQLRFDFDDRNVNKFPPRLFYAYGANYFASVTLRF
jgi:hypothetical protein